MLIYKDRSFTELLLQSIKRYWQKQFAHPIPIICTIGMGLGNYAPFFPLPVPSTFIIFCNIILMSPVLTTKEQTETQGTLHAGFLSNAQRAGVNHQVRQQLRRKWVGDVSGFNLKKGHDPKCQLSISSSDAAWLAELLKHFVFCSRRANEGCLLGFCHPFSNTCHFAY